MALSCGAWYCWSTRRFFRLSDHAELGDEVECFLDVQIERFETWVNTDVILVEAFALGDPFESFNRSADELGDIVDTGQNLGIRILFDELEELSVDDFDTRNLVGILIQNLVL